MVRKIKAKLVLQLRNHGLTGRASSLARGITRHSIQAVIDAAEQLGLGLDYVAEMSEGEVHLALFPGRGVRESVFAQPDWVQMHRELARVGVTLKLLHQEYLDGCSRAGQAAMSYDRFCRLYSNYANVTGASSSVGHLDMRQESWLRAHAAMFAFFGGTVPRLVPDNLKTGLIPHPREGEVVLNDAYREMAAHYSAAVHWRRSIDCILAGERLNPFRGDGPIPRPGLLKSQIPAWTWVDWDEAVSGFVEIDFVDYEGDNSFGEFCFTLTVTDICTVWTVNRSLRNKAAPCSPAMLSRSRSPGPGPGTRTTTPVWSRRKRGMGQGTWRLPPIQHPCGTHETQIMALSGQLETISKAQTAGRVQAHQQGLEQLRARASFNGSM